MRLRHIALSSYRHLISKKAFTISEMLIVTTVMAFLMTAGIKTYFSERDRYEFNNALLKMTNIFKTAKNLATTSSPVYINSTIGNVIPADGYGVHINIDPDPARTDDLPVMTLFANLGGPGGEKKDYQNDDDPNTFNVGFSSDQVIETYEIPHQLIINYFIFDGTDQWGKNPISNLFEPNKTEAIVFFRPPMAETLIRGPSGLTHNDKTFITDNAYMNIETLGIRILNINVPETSPARCQFIYLNRIKTFPELTSGACD